MRQFQKISIPTPWKVTGNSEGVGVSKANIFKGKFGAKLEFSEGWAQTEKPSMGEVGIFSGTTHFGSKLENLNEVVKDS